MDKSLHPARPHNQTLVLSNHLVITTVEFLNKFAEECDAKLCKLHQKMQRLEIEVKLLEFKLSSIPGALLPAIAWILASMCMQWAVSPSRRAGLASRRSDTPALRHATGDGQRTLFLVVPRRNNNEVFLGCFGHLGPEAKHRVSA